MLAAQLAIFTAQLLPRLFVFAPAQGAAAQIHKPLFRSVGVKSDRDKFREYNSERSGLRVQHSEVVVPNLSQSIQTHQALQLRVAISRARPRGFHDSFFFSLHMKRFSACYCAVYYDASFRA